MRIVLSLLLAAVTSSIGVGAAVALEFVADLVTKKDGHAQRTGIYYKQDKWRLEHNTNGPVSITIVRKDKQVMWLLLARMKHFKTLAYDPRQALRVNERLDGETAREEIGSEVLEGHPTTLYEVVAREGTEDVAYYQWVAMDIHFPLRLARKDGSWTVEYRNLKLRALPDELFQIPLTYLPLERWNQLPRKRSGSVHRQKLPRPSPAESSLPIVPASSEVEPVDAGLERRSY